MRKALQNITRKVSLKRIIRRRNLKKMLVDFADEYGLVYFGHVSWQDDEHHIVRGLTLSTNHQDLHYCIGTYEGYDVAFVERRDLLKAPGSKRLLPHRWHIMEFDLHSTTDLPHVFIGLHTSSDSYYQQLFTKFPKLQPLRLGVLSQHSTDFLTGRRVYGTPDDAITIERIFTSEITREIHKHFGAFAIEIHENSLYIYSEKMYLSSALLVAMIKNGVWLARHIDEVSKEL